MNKIQFINCDNDEYYKIRCTFSMGTSRTMKFVDNSDESVKNQILNDNSLLVSSRFSQEFWRHSIEKCESNEVRYSFTFMLTPILSTPQLS